MVNIDLTYNPVQVVLLGGPEPSSLRSAEPCFDRRPEIAVGPGHLDQMGGGTLVGSDGVGSGGTGTGCVKSAYSGLVA